MTALQETLSDLRVVEVAETFRVAGANSFAVATEKLCWT